MISHTDARLAARCAAVSGDVRSRSTGCAISRVGVRLNTFSGFATGHLTVAGNGVGAGSAVGLVCKNATHIHHARIICTFLFVALPLTGRLSKIVPGASSNPVALIWSVMGVFVVLQVIGIVSWNSQVVKSSPLPGTPSLGPRVVSHPGIVEVVPPGNGTVFVMVRFLTP
jgi:hypothetical protein